jgi:hypothetical protein
MRLVHILLHKGGQKEITLQIAIFPQIQPFLGNAVLLNADFGGVAFFAW